MAICCNIFAMECWISVSYLTRTLLIVQLKLTPYDGAGAISKNTSYRHRVYRLQTIQTGK